MPAVSPIDFGLGRPTTVGLKPIRPDYSYFAQNSVADPSSSLRQIAVIADRSIKPTANAEARAASKKQAQAQQAYMKAFEKSLKKQQDAINKQIKAADKKQKAQEKKDKKNKNIKPNLPKPGPNTYPQVPGMPKPNNNNNLLPQILPEIAPAPSVPHNQDLQDLLDYLSNPKPKPKPKTKKKKKKATPGGIPGAGGHPI